MTYKIIEGDCIDVMRGMDAESVDSIVTDPPYGLSFMNAKWDYDVPGVEVWREALRVLKPGGHLLAFAGTRTHHRMAVNIEDAGFEIRDMLGWIYGSGFPKSLDVSKAIDKAAGVERGEEQPHPMNSCKGGKWCHCGELDATGRFSPTKHPSITAPATEAAQQWDGWGTALKPAFEQISLARKPLTGTVAANVLEHGTGGLNVDGCRVGIGEEVPGGGRSFGACEGVHEGWKRPGHVDYEAKPAHNKGRFPANIIHDGSDEVLAVFPDTTSGKLLPSHVRTTDKSPNGIYGKFDIAHPFSESFGDSGSAARFFYAAKTSKAERDAGCETFHRESDRTKDDGPGGDNPRNRTNQPRRNFHPTVKPVDLMRYLCRLVTPPSGVVLDMFMGSGSTLLAAHEEGFESIGIEISPEYCEIARRRIWEATRQQRLF